MIWIVLMLLAPTNFSFEIRVNVEFLTVVGRNPRNIDNQARIASQMLLRVHLLSAQAYLGHWRVSHPRIDSFRVKNLSGEL